MKALILILASVSMLLGPANAQWQPIPSGTIDSLTAITWIQDRFMVAGGDQTFLRSFDNGISFSATAGYEPDMSPGSLTALAFHDSLVGYGRKTYICCGTHRTFDGGVTWEAPDINTQAPPRLPVNGTDQVVFKKGAGTRFSTNGDLLDETEIAMQVELDSVCPVPGEGNCLVFLWDGDTVLSTGSYGWTITSSDRGETIQSGNFPYASYFYSAHVISGDTVAYEAFDDLFISHDKGVSWLRRTPFPHTYPLITPAFRMFSAAKGMAWGSDGRIHMTTDSAWSWFPVTDPYPYQLNDLLFLDDDHLLAVGDNGTILASSDGGYTWEEEESGTDARLHGLALGDDAVIIIGNDGVILRRYPALSGFPTTVPEHANLGMALYPNPASTNLTIHMESGSGAPRFSVLDALGRRHRVSAVSGGNGRWTIDIAELAGGAHILECVNNGVATRRTFVVVK